MEPEATKQCRKCKQFLPVSIYTKLTRASDGLNPVCRPCWYGPGWSPGRKKRQRVEKTDDELRLEARQRRNILVPLEPIVREEPIWIREERKIEEPKQPEPEQKRIEPEIDLDAEKATEQEQREFVRRFVAEYIRRNGETCDEFFIHWIQHRYPEIDQELIRRTITVMVKSGRLRVSREDRVDGVCFLALA
jgi:hypothetical protein